MPAAGYGILDFDWIGGNYHALPAILTTKEEEDGAGPYLGNGNEQGLLNKKVGDTTGKL